MRTNKLKIKCNTVSLVSNIVFNNKHITNTEYVTTVRSSC